VYQVYRTDLDRHSYGAAGVLTNLPVHSVHLVHLVHPFSR
jgi:hypothetical protein